LAISAACDGNDGGQVFSVVNDITRLPARLKLPFKQTQLHISLSHHGCPAVGSCKGDLRSGRAELMARSLAGKVAWSQDGSQRWSTLIPLTYHQPYRCTTDSSTAKVGVDVQRGEMEEAEKRVAAVLRSGVSCQNPSVSHNASK
jgi:hypothetical protein